MIISGVKSDSVKSNIVKSDVLRAIVLRATVLRATVLRATVLIRISIRFRSLIYRLVLIFLYLSSCTYLRYTALYLSLIYRPVLIFDIPPPQLLEAYERMSTGQYTHATPTLFNAGCPKVCAPH